MESLIEGALEYGATAFGVVSGTGGATYLSRSVRRRVIKLTIAKAHGRAAILVGVSSFATAEVAANVDEAAQAGADAVLLQPFASQQLRAEEVLGLYRDVATVSSLPVIIDNNPTTTHYRISTSELARLVPIKGIVGVKDSAATASEARQRRERVLGALSPRTARRTEYGFATSSFGAQALIDGADTWHSAVAAVLPEYCGAIAYAATNRRRAEARQMQRALAPLGMLSEQWGAIRVVHAIGTLRGLDMGVPPRPLLPLPREANALVRVTLNGLRVDDDLLAATRDAAAARAASHAQVSRDGADSVSPTGGRHTTGR
ncbi:dihydrodipicolinate synthase family protein [Rarobacter incanus]